MKSNMFATLFLDISDDVDLGADGALDKNPSMELNYDEVPAKADENNAFSRIVVRRRCRIMRWYRRLGQLQITFCRSAYTRRTIK